MRPSGERGIVSTRAIAYGQGKNKGGAKGILVSCTQFVFVGGFVGRT